VMSRQTQKVRSYAPHPWIILFTALALAAVYLIHVLTPHQTTAEAATSLTPVLSPPGGTYDRDVQLEIHAPNSKSLGEAMVTSSEVTVIFTVDGSVPTPANGRTYTHTIRLSASTPAVTVVRARAVLPGPRLGPVVSASYFVGVPFSSKGHSNIKGSEATHSNIEGSEATHSDGTPFSSKGHSDGTPATLPMMSLIVDPDDLWDPEGGIYANPTERGDAWERPVDVTYVDKDRRSGFHIAGGLRIHGKSSRYFAKKSLRLYFRREYGTSRLEYPLFANGDVQSFKRLVLHSGGEDWQFAPEINWTLMRNDVVATLALQLDAHAARCRPVLLFINGEPWGIYQIRERIDRHFLADHYGVNSADFLEDPQLLNRQAVHSGGDEDWDQFLEFIRAHDLADPENYAYVQTQVDVADFVDYTILQIYIANIDWPFHNIQQFRPRVQGGRWHWVFWDTDRGFGAYPCSENANLIGRVLDDAHPETGGRDTLLLRKLLENPAFFDQFLSRTADLLNTTLAPTSVTAHIDALSAELAPDISYEAMRWTSSVDWQSSVEGLRDFARYRPDFVREHIVESFGLSGTAGVTFNLPTSGSGSVAVNECLIQDLPWRGVYFQDIPIQVMAAPAPGFRFAGWEPDGLPQNPVITLTVSAPLTITPRFEAVGDDVPRPGDVVFASYRMEEDSYITGDRLELMVSRPGGVDLRGWRVTDNDTKTAMDEGSLVFANNPAFARVPQGTVIRIVASQEGEEQANDDLGTWDREMVLYAGNGNLDANLDPGFNLGPNDNLALLAPGPGSTFGDDVGIAFESESQMVTPASFGVLVDGVWPASAGGEGHTDR